MTMPHDKLAQASFLVQLENRKSITVEIRVDFTMSDERYFFGRKTHQEKFKTDITRSRKSVSLEFSELIHVIFASLHSHSDDHVH